MISCGGVRACLESAHDPAAGGNVIGPWMSILTPVRDRVLRDNGEDSPERRQRALELAGIVQSIENLHSFPFVAQAVAAGELALLDSASGEFKTVD